MLLSIILALTPTASAALPAYAGPHAHGWFLHEVQRLDPALSRRLHRSHQDRPFTVSNLWTQSRARGNTLAIEAGERCALRITSFERRLSEQIKAHWPQGLPGSAIRLGAAQFTVSQVILDQKQHPWAGETDYTQLTMQFAQRKLPNHLALEFVSPTVFRSQGFDFPFPLPRLVIEGLARRWNQFAPVPVHPDAVQYAEEAMAVSRYALATERVLFGAGSAQRGFPGFRGRCRYALRGRDAHSIADVHLLAAFAFYAGVGRHTAMGLGQTRVGPGKS